MCFQSGDGFKALPYMCSPPFMATIPIAKIESEEVNAAAPSLTTIIMKNGQSIGAFYKPEGVVINYN